jgi:hypothetical protein
LIYFCDLEIHSRLKNLGKRQQSNSNFILKSQLETKQKWVKQIAAIL